MVERKKIRIESLEGEDVDLFLAGRKVRLEKSGSVVADL